MLDDNSFTSNAKFLDQELYYDDRYRVIKSVEQLYYNGSSSWSYYQVISTKYDFAGTIEETRTKHYLGGITNIIEQEYSYDHVGRLTTVAHKLNSNTQQILSTQTYNDLGVLKQKIVGGSSSTVCAQIMDYNYNIRGWLTSINNVNSSSTGKKLFSMELLYESTSGLPSTTTAQYNGNISGVKWRTPYYSSISSPSSIQTYGYVYDGLNRLQTAKYLESYKTEYYDVAIEDYDLNGNIGSITRKYKGSLIDNLTLGYSGNRLSYVSDYSNDNMGFTEVSNSTQEYSYDSNGNMTKDDNKDLSSISYNVLNLPSELIGGTTNINYIYDGSGRKLVKSVTGGSSPTYYYGALVFNGSTLDYVLHDEGMVEFASSSTGSYSYHLKDHLGNVRMVVDAGGSREQQNDYYPFGMEFASGGNSSNKYKYNGKEAQDDYIGVHKLGWLDYGARMYDPSLGHFLTADPHAENYYSWSPNHYVANNPILITDPTGMDWFVDSENGNVLYVKGVEELSEKQIKMYGANYVNFGADDMFGDEIILDSRDGNIVDRIDYLFGTADGEDFMEEQGYDKAMEQTYRESISEFSSTGDDDGIQSGKTTNVEITNIRITYVKSDQMHQRKQTEYYSDPKPFHSADKVYYQINKYRRTVPYNCNLISGQSGKVDIGTPGVNLLKLITQNITETLIRKKK